MLSQTNLGAKMCRAVFNYSENRLRFDATKKENILTGMARNSLLHYIILGGILTSGLIGGSIFLKDKGIKTPEIPWWSILALSIVLPIIIKGIFSINRLENARALVREVEQNGSTDDKNALSSVSNVIMYSDPVAYHRLFPKKP
jgi:hypothetical protein